MSDDLKKSEINDEFLLSQGTSLFKQMKSSAYYTEERRKKDLDLYEGEFSEQEKKYSDFLGAPRLFINKTYTYVHRILIECLETIFFDPDEIVTVDSDKDIPLENKQAIKALINYRLNSHPIDFYKEVYDLSLDAIRNQKGIFKVYPKLKTKKIPKLVEIQAEGVEGSYIVEHPTEEDEVVESYTPCIEAIPPEDVFFHSNATWKDYFNFPMVHRYTKTKDHLKRMGYKNIDALGGTVDTTLGDMTKMNRYKNQSPFAPTSTIGQQDSAVVYEVWDLLPGKDGLLESGSYILLGDISGPNVVGRGWEVNELPYKFDEFEYNRPPFVLGVAYPESHKLEGKSFPWITDSLQKETNAQRNQEREAVARALRPHVYVNRDSGVDLMALVNRRIGNYIQGDGPAGEAIQELPTMNPMAISSSHQARTDRDYSENGLSENLVGGNSGDDTATEATQRLQNANKKISAVIKNLANTAYLPALRMLLRLEQAYCTDEFVQKITGKLLGWGKADDSAPSMATIQGDFDLKLNLGIGKQAQINKMLLLMDRMNQANQGLAQLVQLGVADPKNIQFGDPMKVFDYVLSISGNKNLGEFKFPAQPPPPQEGDTPGIASQARNVMDPSQQISNMSPEASGALNVIG
jgi:hypothetical protein